MAGGAGGCIARVPASAFLKLEARPAIKRVPLQKSVLPYDWQGQVQNRVLGSYQGNPTTP